MVVSFDAALHKSSGLECYLLSGFQEGGILRRAIVGHDPGGALSGPLQGTAKPASCFIWDVEKARGRSGGLRPPHAAHLLRGLHYRGRRCCRWAERPQHSTRRW